MVSGRLVSIPLVPVFIFSLSSAVIVCTANVVFGVLLVLRLAQLIAFAGVYVVILLWGCRQADAVIALIRDVPASALTPLPTGEPLEGENGRRAGDAKSEDVNSVWLCTLNDGPDGSLPRLIFFGDLNIREVVIRSLSSTLPISPNRFGDSLIAFLKGDCGGRLAGLCTVNCIDLLSGDCGAALVRGPVSSTAFKFAVVMVCSRGVELGGLIGERCIAFVAGSPPVSRTSLGKMARSASLSSGADAICGPESPDFGPSEDLDDAGPAFGFLIGLALKPLSVAVGLLDESSDVFFVLVTSDFARWTSSAPDLLVWTAASFCRTGLLGNAGSIFVRLVRGRSFVSLVDVLVVLLSLIPTSLRGRPRVGFGALEFVGITVIQSLSCAVLARSSSTV